ncbi:hypothetical protein QJS63_28540 [Pseudomonas juntendi]|nr:hypothetical protein QJS63_28540 [Pseudomonas juntendi]
MSKPDNQVNELHLRDPKPGDFWHERFCPYHIVLAVTPAGVVIADKTKPDGDSHYTFDLESAREITHEEHAKAVRYSSGSGFAADVVPVRAALSAREWKAAGSKYIAVAEQKAAPHAGEALMDTNKMLDLKALAEAAGSDEWYAAGDLRYCDDKTGETHGLHHDDGRFIAAASPAAILALLAEIERLEMDNRSLKGSCSKLGAEHAGMSRLYKKANRMQFEARQERDQLKAENEALRKALGEISGQVDGNIRCAVRDVVNCRGDVQDIYGYCDNIDEIIDAAMTKEASHG